MPLVARLQSSRRVVIPQEIAEHLRVDEGDLLLFRKGRNGTAIIAAAEVQPKTA